MKTIDHTSIGRAKTLDEMLDITRLSRAQLGIVAFCGLVAMLDGFDTQAIAFVAPQIAHHWNVSAGDFGAVFGAGLFGGLVGAVAVGRIADVAGRKPALLCAVVLFALATLATVLVEDVRTLILVRFITGLGLGGALPCFVALTAEYAPRRLRTTLVAGVFCGFPFGAVVGGAASAVLLPKIGWQGVFVVAGAAPLLSLPLLWRFIPESAQFLMSRGRADEAARIMTRVFPAVRWDGVSHARDEIKASVAELFTPTRATGTLLLWCAFFLSLLLTYFLINWLPLLVARESGDMQNAVLAVVVLNLGAICGCLLIGRTGDRFGPALVVGAAFAVGAGVIASMGLIGQSTWLLFSAAFAAGFMSLGAQMCTVALCAAFYETNLRSTGIGWAVGVGRIGAIAGPVIGGVLVGGAVDQAILFPLVALTSLGAAAAVFALRWRLYASAEGAERPLREKRKKMNPRLR
ncbi:MFS transporter [Chelatococcus asaccharovorans]|uniref:AAHS family 4-hydroxybenzoate transporter-like MFS transporter n=1 Tax=Chelatococcus asaccharovorans TaxID=28210 RepID=A0A2V3UGA0_9HYPH|nr:MFS transporter [Chelatococcus asaccharovorans]MBS7701899.1 MFS transporter [Chelatococcus asaccharovorans]PXW64392.1 AAHS family 4-hydroxybenzoate transporter-like MFS transporter [Chelatococcus asaccharovorans]